MKIVAPLDFDRHVLLELVLLPIKFKTAEIVSEKTYCSSGKQKEETKFQKKITLAGNKVNGAMWPKI